MRIRFQHLNCVYQRLFQVNFNRRNLSLDCSACQASRFKNSDLHEAAKFSCSAAGMSRQTLIPGASSKIDAEITRVQNEIKSLDRSISAQQQQRNALSANLDSLLAAKEKSDMLAPSLPLTAHLSQLL